MSLKTWRNREDAGVIQKIIENNFKILGRHLNKTMLCLTTKERNTLTTDYLSDGLIVYDTDLEKLLKYHLNTSSWELFSFEAASTQSYSQSFSTVDWVDNIIFIPYLTHLVPNPTIQMFILYGDSYHPVLGGVNIDEEFNVTLSTDLPFDGKVVIK